MISASSRADLSHGVVLPVQPASQAWHTAQLDAQERTAANDPCVLLGGLLAGADFAAVCSLAILFLSGRPGADNAFGAFPLAVAAALLFVQAMWRLGLYRARLTRVLSIQVVPALVAWFAVVATMVVLLWCSRSQYALDARRIAVFAASGGLILIVLRAAAIHRLHRWQLNGRLTTTLAIVEVDGRGADLARLVAAASPQVEIAGVFSAAAAPSSGRTIADLVRLARIFRIDEVRVLVGPGADESLLTSALRELATIFACVRVQPSLPAFDGIANHGPAQRNEEMLLTIQDHPLKPWGGILKRAEDILLGGLALLLLSPVMLVIALLVRFDSPGPCLFRQPRHGFNNRTITVLKFRTMRHGPAEQGTIKQATRTDARITRVGGVLRRTSLDELPQLINVLRGDMSLVGPRPHAVIQNEQYSSLIDSYSARHRVRPGITGWAQVNGLRGETDTLDKMQRRIELDVAYIRSWSILLDLRIILRTAVSVLFDRAAY